ncbi:hypothetical protein ACLUXJ_04195 [Lactobacillus porci]|uniref:hypothetical protein n=1 Tax=Lactobacillus porci TaxID=2012477 RepID=UPI003991E17F
MNRKGCVAKKGRISCQINWKLVGAIWSLALAIGQWQEDFDEEATRSKGMNEHGI